MLIKCEWKTCINYKKGICKAAVIELESFDYEEEHEELEGLKCGSYKYDYFWMCDNGRQVNVRG